MAERSEILARAGIRAAHAASAMLSPLSIDSLRALGAVAGDVAFRLNGRAARTTRTNIDLVYASGARAWRRRLARASLRHTAMTVAEGVALWTWPLPRLRALLREVEGEELLRGRTPGRGVVVIVPHFGNWEMLGFYLNTVEPLVPLYERPASPAVDAALRAARARLGHRSAADSVSGLRHLIGSLRNGAMAAILPDQVPVTGAGVTAPFFGRPAYTMTLLGKLLSRVDCAVVTGAATRVDGGFSVRIEPVADAVFDQDPVVSAAAINAAVETVAARDPAQYQWEYKRFRFPRQPNVYV